MSTRDDYHGASAAARRGVVAVVRRATRFLVIRRSKHVVAPGALCFPGGGIETGENEAAALSRELREELDVRVEPLRCVWRSRTAWNVELAWWIADLPVSQRPTPNPAEVESVHWLTAGELRGHADTLTSNIDFLEACRRECLLADRLDG